MTFQPVQFVRRARHPIFAISLLLLLLTLAVWLAAALFPRARYAINWIDNGSNIDVGIETFEWDRGGYYFEHTRIHYDGRVNVAPGAENHPVILQITRLRSGEL